MPLTAAQRALYGRIGGAIARSRHDPKQLTAAGRSAFLARFEARIRADYPDLPDAEVQRRAGELRRAYMLALSAKSSIARSKKRTAPVAHTETVLEVRGRDATPPTRAA